MLSFSFANPAEISDESAPVFEDAPSNMEESSEKISSHKNLECVIEDEVFGCWAAVENEEDCESGTTAYQTDESNQILCLVEESAVDSQVTPEEESRYFDAPIVTAAVDHSETKECVIDDEVLGCWAAVENAEDCESKIVAYQTEESNQMLCLVE